MDPKLPDLPAGTPSYTTEEAKQMAKEAVDKAKDMAKDAQGAIKDAVTK